MNPRIGRLALTYGAAAGVILGLVDSIFSFMPYNDYRALSMPFMLLMWIVVLLGIGVLAAKRTGKISVGTLAGLWAGLIGCCLAAVIQLGELFFHGYGYSPSALALLFTAQIIQVLFLMGVGTGLGALGGLIGQSFAHSSAIPAVLQQRPSDPPQNQE